MSDRCSRILDDIHRSLLAEARAIEARGIDVARLDLETQSFPWADASVDVVVCNQVFEHLKNVWRPMSEMHRVLRPGGWLLISVPNLASLHNRILLAFGAQPTSIRTFGPHVRGFTRRELERFVAHRGAFAIVRSRGVGFHPLVPPWSRPLNAVWPGASHTLVVVARKTGASGSPWLESVDGGAQTYYREDAATPDAQAE